MKKLEENCNFPFLGFFFAPLEAKMMKNDEKMMKKWFKKNVKKMIKKNEDDKINDKKWWMQW